MNGAFEASPLVFVLDDGFTVVDFVDGATIAVDDLDDRLRATDRIPELGGAPIASWVLARLAALTGSKIGSGHVEHIDGGVYVLDFIVRIEQGAVAKIQIQGGTIGLGLLGVAQTAAVADEIVDRFSAAVLADPAGLADVELRVVDPSREDGRAYCYGFADGRLLLGLSNDVDRGES